jgi:hypothetical protein
MAGARGLQIWRTSLDYFTSEALISLINETWRSDLHEKVSPIKGQYAPVEGQFASDVYTSFLKHSQNQ